MDIAVIIPFTNIDQADRAESTLRDHAATDRIRISPVPIFDGIVKTMAKEGARFKRSDLLMFLRQDVQVLQEGWDEALGNLFRYDQHTGLAGIRGATGLGHLNLYKFPYEPQQLDWFDEVTSDGYQEKRVAVLGSEVLVFSRKSYADYGGWDEPLSWDFPSNSDEYATYASCRMAELGYHTYRVPIRIQCVSSVVSDNRQRCLQSDGLAHIYGRFKDTLPLRVFSS